MEKVRECVIRSFCYIRTSNFGAEVERSYIFYDLRLS